MPLNPILHFVNSTFKYHFTILIVFSHHSYNLRPLCNQSSTPHKITTINVCIFLVFKILINQPFAYNIFSFKNFFVLETTRYSYASGFFTFYNIACFLCLISNAIDQQLLSYHTDQNFLHFLYHCLFSLFNFQWHWSTLVFFSHEPISQPSTWFIMKESTQTYL